jgi:hypothetical protein
LTPTRSEPLDPRFYDEDGNANPLMRASEFCAAFYGWAKAIDEALRDPDVSDYEKDQLRPISEHLAALYIPIRKSNYLWRRIYLGQKHRTKKCPNHKGRWSGYLAFDDPKCACQSGYDATGWLPADGDDRAVECQPRSVRGANPS